MPLKTPYSIGKIAPALQAFERGQKKELSLQYGMTPDDVVNALITSNFLTTRQVVFIVHGFESNFDASWMHQMKDAILKKEHKTVILVGWGKGAKLGLTNYEQAAGNTQAVGAWLAQHAKALKRRRVNIWGIGHSLGAHVLGKAGRDSGAFDRITGLDPAGPSFEQVNQDKRLDPRAATFVDVIHTDGYRPRIRTLNFVSPVNHYGTLIPLGSIDFYPNHGYEQRECVGTVGDAIGSHNRAIELFIMSIETPDDYKTDQVFARAPKFEDPVKETRKGPTAQMGYYADKFHGVGNYYLPTHGPNYQFWGCIAEYGPTYGTLAYLTVFRH